MYCVVPSESKKVYTFGGLNIMWSIFKTEIFIYQSKANFSLSHLEEIPTLLDENSLFP